ncbi:UNVERIFIED_CONTAM: hypothetical protein FKN15_040024 [Acipenser sinensis]
MRHSYPLYTYLHENLWGEKASRDVSVASILFQNLLENLDIQYSRFGQESEAFLLQHNFRSFKQNFQYLGVSSFCTVIQPQGRDSDSLNYLGHIVYFSALLHLHYLQANMVYLREKASRDVSVASILFQNLLENLDIQYSRFGQESEAFLLQHNFRSFKQNFQLSEMLSWQFLSVTKRGLNKEQLRMLAEKLFGRQLSYENCRLPWARFSKENFQNNNFSFWAWIDGIRTLVKSYLEDLWNEGYIMGFVSKGKEKTLLKKQQHGTFLLRFSESCKDGAITFSWVDHFSNGKSNVRTVQPFTKNDLSQIPFVEILRNFQILVDENVPENPLKFLYPNIPKDDALWKYYAENDADGENPYKKYIKTKLIIVTSDKSNDVQSAQSTDTINGSLATPDCPGDALPQSTGCATQNEEAPPDSKPVVCC